MTKQYSIFFLIFIFLGVVSCQNNVDEDILTTNKRFKTPGCLHDTLPLNIALEDLPYYAAEYVAAYPELFGDEVMIFDTWEGLDNELDSLQNMTYSEQRAWLVLHNFNSPVLNSLIIHDSVQRAVWHEFGIEFDSTTFDNSNLEIIEDYIEDEELHMLEELAFEQYDAIMENDFSEYVKTTIDQNGIVKLSPLGSLNEQVFCNTEKLYVCEGVVVKYLDDGILSCPINVYNAELAQMNTIGQINAYQSRVSSPHIYVHPSATTKRTFASDENLINPPYRTEVNFEVYVTWSMFGFERKCTYMCATNFHRKSDGSYRCVSCGTKIIADVGIECLAGTWDYHFRTGWWWMGGGMTYYRIQYVVCGCPDTKFSYINLNLINQHGVEIAKVESYNN